MKTEEQVREALAKAYDEGRTIGRAAEYDLGVALAETKRLHERFRSGAL